MYAVRPALPDNQITNLTTHNKELEDQTRKNKGSTVGVKLTMAKHCYGSRLHISLFPLFRNYCKEF